MTGVGLGYDSVVSKRGQHWDNKEGGESEVGEFPIGSGFTTCVVKVHISSVV